MYKLIPAPADCNDDLFYCSYDEEQNKLNGAIGHFFAGFNHEGEYWSTWHDIQPNLQTDSFQEEVAHVIAFLREDGQPLASPGSISAFAVTQPGINIENTDNDQVFGYIIKTKNYSYYIRLRWHRSYDPNCTIAFIAHDNNKLAGE
jgi:hypothetical protein